MRHPVPFFSMCMAIAVAAVVLGGCGSSEQSDATDPAPQSSSAALRGVFGPASGVVGSAIDGVEFVDDVRYRLIANGCAEASCIESGRYAHDRTQRQLHLTVDGTGRQYSLAFEIPPKGERTSLIATSSLRPTDDAPGGGTQLVDQQSQLLIQTAIIAGQEFMLVDAPLTTLTNAGHDTAKAIAH